MTPITALKLAMTNAVLSEHDVWKLGALLTKKSPLSSGTNQMANNPKQVHEDHVYGLGTHAEEMALRGTHPDNTNGANIYVARATRGGNVGMARPCSRCMQAIVDAGIKKVFYTAGEDCYGVLKVNSLHTMDPRGEKIVKFTTSDISDFMRIIR